MKKSTTIPFSGFYGSIHDQELDYALDSVFQDESGDPYEGLVTRAFDTVNWRLAHVRYAKDYTENFAIRFELPSLKFDDLDSPREYNFTTDRIFCSIELSDIEKMFSAVNKEKLEEKIKERFTSRSGFMSYYPNSLSACDSDLSTWDHNEVGTLMEVYVEQLSEKEFDQWAELEILGDLHHEYTYELMCECIEDKRLFTVHDYLREREMRKWR